MKALLLAAAAASWLAGQQGQITGPSMGLVYDGAARAVRPVVGIAGAARIGAAMDFGFDLSAAYVAPHLDSALVVDAHGSPRLFRVRGQTVAELAVPGLSRATRHVAFSPSGSALALDSGAAVLVIAGLPDAPVVARTVEFPRSPRRDREPAARTSIAISDDGAELLLVASGSVLLLDSEGSRGLMPAGADALVAFAAGSHDAAVLDPRGAGLVLWRDLGGAAGRQALAPAGDALAAPAGLAFSADGRRLLVAGAAAKAVAVIDAASGAASSFPCSCTPVVLEPMGPLFRLTEPGPEPLWFLDPRAGEERILFVPVPGPS